MFLTFVHCRHWIFRYAATWNTGTTRFCVSHLHLKVRLESQARWRRRWLPAARCHRCHGDFCDLIRQRPNSPSDFRWIKSNSRVQRLCCKLYRTRTKKKRTSHDERCSFARRTCPPARLNSITREARFLTTPTASSRVSNICVDWWGASVFVKVG